MILESIGKYWSRLYISIFANIGQVYNNGWIFSIYRSGSYLNLYVILIGFEYIGLYRSGVYLILLVNIGRGLRLNL